ncbi:MAG: hypothetical protein WBX25_04495 [Rhodomicrobium sp.]
MIRCRHTIGVLAAALAFASPAVSDDNEPSLVVEMAGAAGWGLKHGDASYGPAIDLEYTVIEHWLEIEVGTSPQFSGGQVDSTLIFF